jgi:hypothetical protein
MNNEEDKTCFEHVKELHLQVADFDFYVQQDVKKKLSFLTDELGKSSYSAIMACTSSRDFNQLCDAVEMLKDQVTCYLFN